MMNPLGCSVGRMLGTCVSVLAGSAAFAQPAAPESSAREWMHAFGSAGDVTIIVLVILLIIGAGMIWYLSRQPKAGPMMGVYYEPEAESSRFEQILAEIQGLYLRLQSGEQRGDYRKIDQLARTLLERLGHRGAREMKEEQIRQLLPGGVLSQPQAEVLGSIFDRCQIGMSQEGSKLDFSPLQLIKDLRELIGQLERENLKLK